MAQDPTTKRCPKCQVNLPDPELRLVDCPMCGGPLVVPHIFVVKPAVLGAKPGK